MTGPLDSFRRIAAARCEREERRRLAANTALLALEAERARAAAEQRRAEAREVEAAAFLLREGGHEQAQVWRRVCQERALEQTRTLDRASAVLADARQDAAEARHRHERREQQARLAQRRCAADRRERERLREDAEDDERVHRPRSIFTWGNAR